MLHTLYLTAAEAWFSREDRHFKSPNIPKDSVLLLSDNTVQDCRCCPYTGRKVLLWHLDQN